MRPVIHRMASAVLAAGMAGTAHAHWPDQPPHQMAQLGELKLEGGGVIPNLKMSYVTHGKLNAARDNAILFLHGFGGNHHLIDHLIGPGRALDTDKYFIICSDALGFAVTFLALAVLRRSGALDRRARDSIAGISRRIASVIISFLMNHEGESIGIQQVRLAARQGCCGNDHLDVHRP